MHIHPALINYTLVNEDNRSIQNLNIGKRLIWPKTKMVLGGNQFPFFLNVHFTNNRFVIQFLFLCTSKALEKLLLHFHKFGK